ncbi:MAG: alpha/beta fold hydrolase [Pyrinomonadaceae bacterium]
MPDSPIGKEENKHGKARVRGIELAYEDVGAGPQVVLLHGYPFNRTMWREQVAQLSQNHRVMAPDLRGHGESEVAPGPATMEDMARDIAGLMDLRRIPRVTIVGLSMGGYVALEFCRLFPARVRALVLADTRAQGDTEEGKQNRAAQAEKALAEGMEGIAYAMLPKLLAPETVAKRPEIVRRVRDMMVQTKPEGAVAALQGMAQRRDQRPMLSGISAPTLIIVGSEDTLTPHEDSELMHREIGGSSLKIIEGAAHVSNIERSEEFNDALLNFLHDNGA